MFSDIRQLADLHNSLHFSQLTVMPLASVTDCTDASGDPTVGAASTNWPGSLLCSSIMFMLRFAAVFFFA